MAGGKSWQRLVILLPAVESVFAGGGEGSVVGIEDWADDLGVVVGEKPLGGAGVVGFVDVGSDGGREAAVPVLENEIFVAGEETGGKVGSFEVKTAVDGK